LTEEDAKASYDKMFTAYIKTFLRMGLTPISLRAKTGPIGGNLSHEFQILAKTGESTLYYDKDLEKVDTKNIEPKKLQNYYAAVDDLYNPGDCPISQDQLKISKGIEVGHIFYFGTKYSEKLGAYIQDNKGQKVAVHMGSYGIGVSRLVGAIIEAYHDEKGIKWPLSVAPFHVSIINLMVDDPSCKKISDKIYQKLSNKNLEILYDERDCSIGKKLADNELIGIPFQVIVGKRDLKDNLIELKNRTTNESKKISPEEVINFLLKLDT
jgi:prolyl-tRNA synthetase